MPYMAVEVPLHEGLFENICLIDTPGYDSGGENATEDRKTAIDFLRSLFKTPIGPLCGGIKYFGVKRFS